MGFNILVAFLDSAESIPSALSFFYHDEVYKDFLLVLIKEGVEKIDHSGDIRHKKVSEMVEAINHTTALHLAVAKNRPDIVTWFIKNKPRSFIEKTCCLRIEEHSVVYEEVVPDSSQFHSQWSITNNGQRISEYKEEHITAKELAEHLGNDCCHLFDQQPRPQ